MGTSGVVRAEGVVTTVTAPTDRVVIQRLETNGQYSPRQITLDNLLSSGVSVRTGVNQRMGTATLVGGTVTVINTSVTANTRIFLTVQSLGTVVVPQAVAVTAKVVGTSFTITSASGTDTSTVAWLLVEGV